MTIVDKLKAAAGVDDDAGKIDAAIATKHRAVEKGREREEKIERAVIAHDAAERAYDLAASTASGPDDPQLTKLRNALEKATRDLEFHRTALRGDKRAIEEADEQLRVLGREKHGKTFRRKTVERAKRADRLSAAIKEYVAATFDYYAITGQIVSAYPFGILPGGCLANRNQVFDLIAKEISRLNPVNPIDAGVLKIPGAYNHPLVNAARFVPLKDEVALSNAHLLKLIEKGPAPSVLPVPAKVKPEPDVVDPELADLLGPPVSGPTLTLTADQVMASIQPRKLAV